MLALAVVFVYNGPSCFSSAESFESNLEFSGTCVLVGISDSLIDMRICICIIGVNRMVTQYQVLCSKLTIDLHCFPSMGLYCLEWSLALNKHHFSSKMSTLKLVKFEWSCQMIFFTK